MSDERIPLSVDEYWPEDADDADEGIVVDWFVKETTAVDEGDTLCEIQVEKVSVDVIAPTGGSIDEIVVGEDDEFTRGDTLAWIKPA